MIIALFALAVLMMVGGVASVVQGFPFVRLESGLAMVIAGATVASAGAVLVGIATVALRLTRLEPALSGLQVTAGQAFARPEPAEMPAAATMPAGETAGGVDGLFELPAPGRQRPSLDGLSVAGVDRLGSRPVFVESEPVSAEPKANRAEDGPAPDPAEPLLPDLLPTPPPLPEPSHDPQQSVVSAEPLPAPPVPDAPEKAALAEPDAPSPPAAPAPEEPVGLRPSLAGAADAPPPQPLADETPPELAPPAEEKHADGPQVVGTYASGGNTYVMFSNGSIEAETPRGRFTFGSLDELKAFVEGGGETEARGAA